MAEPRPYRHAQGNVDTPPQHPEPVAEVPAAPSADALDGPECAGRCCCENHGLLSVDQPRAEAPNTPARPPTARGNRPTPDDTASLQRVLAISRSSWRSASAIASETPAGAPGTAPERRVVHDRLVAHAAISFPAHARVEAELQAQPQADERGSGTGQGKTTTSAPDFGGAYSCMSSP